MPLDLYSTSELMALITDPDFDTLYPGSMTWWVDQFFPTVYNSTAQNIYFDQVDPNDRRLAPFVAPTAQGRVMRDRGYNTKQFKPAYVKSKHAIDPSRTMTRQAGEPLLGSLSPQARYNAIQERNIADEKDEIKRRWNWMAARAIIDGFVTVAGDDYPTTLVDFARDSSLTVTLTGSATWDNSGADVLGSIEANRSNAYTLSRAPTNHLIFGLTAWKNFTNNAAVRNLLTTQNRFGNSNFAIAPFQTGAPVVNQGILTGPAGGDLLQLWTYSDYYDNYDGTQGQYLDPTYVVGVGDAIRGVQCFGAIMDLDSLEAVDIFPKAWANHGDPSVSYTLCQSAPLMVPIRPNNSWRMKTSA